MKYVITVLILYWYIFDFTTCQLLNKHEGAECKEVLNEVWTCQRLSACSQVGDFKRNRPEICGFIEKEPIICCPPNEDILPTNDGGVLPPNNEHNEDDILSSPFDSDLVRKETDVDYLLPPFSGNAPYALTKCIENEVKLCSNDRNNFVAKQPVQNLMMTFRNTEDRKQRPLLRSVRNIGHANFRPNIDPAEYVPVVVGGKPAMKAQFPFVVSIGYGEESDNIWDCGGTTVSERWVLSAAHCAQTKSGPARWIGLGTTEIKNEYFNGMISPISKIIMHPDYKEPAMYHDIALLQMTYKLIFNYAVKPVCLHPLLVIPQNVSVAGWGTTAYGGQKSSSLLFVDLRTIDPKDCQNLYNGSRLLPRGFDSATMICAGETNYDACTGDSGGPLFYKSSICLHVQLGIVSFGRNCGIYPGVYTRISYYLPWIENIVWPVSEREAFNPLKLINSDTFV